MFNKNFSSCKPFSNPLAQWLTRTYSVACLVVWEFDSHQGPCDFPDRLGVRISPRTMWFPWSFGSSNLTKDHVISLSKKVYLFT